MFRVLKGKPAPQRVLFFASPGVETPEQTPHAAHAISDRPPLVLPTPRVVAVPRVPAVPHVLDDLLRDDEVHGAVTELVHRLDEPRLENEALLHLVRDFLSLIELLADAQGVGVDVAPPRRRGRRGRLWRWGWPRSRRR